MARVLTPIVGLVSLCVCCDTAPAMEPGVLCAGCFDREYRPVFDDINAVMNRKEK